MGGDSPVTAQFIGYQLNVASKQMQLTATRDRLSHPVIAGRVAATDLRLLAAIHLMFIKYNSFTKIKMIKRK